MTRLIDADMRGNLIMTKQEVLDYLDNVLHPIVSPDNWNVYSELYDMIEKLPSAEPVRHGKWITEECLPGVAVCSICGHEIRGIGCQYTKYCDGCGARMDEDERD